MRSHPVWVCGLKPTCRPQYSTSFRHTLYGCVDWNLWFLRHRFGLSVTPCMGVWIETHSPWYIALHLRVTPCMGVWIETGNTPPHLLEHPVTPCMGVWIETTWTLQPEEGGKVTPCMGVWIETCRQSSWCNAQQSHPVWVCGLKHTEIRFAVMR